MNIQFLADPNFELKHIHIRQSQRCILRVKANDKSLKSLFLADIRSNIALKIK